MKITRLLARVKNLEINSPHLVDNLMSLNYRPMFPAPGLEFADSRPYVETDQSENIDWNITGRLAEPYTKTFLGEAQLPLFLMADMSASVFAGLGAHELRETADLVFSILALAAANNGDKVGAGFFTDHIEHWVPVRSGKAHALRLIQDLANFTPKNSGSHLGSSLLMLGRALKHRGICVLISDFKSTDYLQALWALAKRHQVIAIRLMPPEDLAFPDIGTVQLEDPETHQIMTAYGSSLNFRKAWHNHWLSQRRQWFHDLRDLGVSGLEIRSDEDPVLKLAQFFQGRGRHR